MLIPTVPKEIDCITIGCPEVLHIFKNYPSSTSCNFDTATKQEPLPPLTRVAMLSTEPHYLDIITGPEMAPDWKRALVFTESSQGIYTGAGAVFSLRSWVDITIPRTT